MSLPASESFIKLLVSGDYSDFKITCQDFTFNVHKCVISQSSEFLKAICDSKFKEGLESRVDLPEEKPYILARVLVFLYAKVYYFQLPEPFEGFGGPTTGGDERTTFLEVYFCADRLGMSEMKEALMLDIAKHFPEHAPATDTGYEPSLSKLLDNTTSEDPLRVRVISNFIRANMLLKKSSYDEVLDKLLGKDKNSTLWKQLKCHEPIAYETALRAAEIIEDIASKERRSSRQFHDHRRTSTRSLKDLKRVEDQLKRAENIMGEYEGAMRGLLGCSICGKPLKVTGSVANDCQISCKKCRHKESIATWIASVKARYPVSPT